jgi:probable F420-dependent oxidoreductase
MLGVVLPFWLDRPPGEATSIAQTADELGYEELWVGELYHFDAFALAANLVERTTSIRPVIGPIATGVRDAVTIARAFSTVAELAGRSVRLALGASNRTLVERFHERSFGGEAHRMRAVAAAVRSQVETGVSPSGYRSALPLRGLHLTVAAFGPRMIEVASEVADRMVVNLVTPDQAAALASAARIPTTAWVVGALDPGPSTRREVAAQVAHYLAAPGYSDMFRSAGFGDLVGRALDRQPLRELAATVPDALLAEVAMYGSRRDVIAAYERYTTAGIEVAVVPATAEDPAGAAVLSLLRSVAGG